MSKPVKPHSKKQPASWKAKSQDNPNKAAKVEEKREVTTTTKTATAESKEENKSKGYKFTETTINNGFKFKFALQSSPDTFLSWKEVIGLWQRDPLFADYFTQILLSKQLPAIYWESIPFKQATLNLTYECVVIESHSLSRLSEGNSKSFSGHLKKSPDSVIIAFENLGGDAMLVVPNGKAENCPHLAAFLKNSPKDDIRELWKRVGEKIEERIVDKQVLWVSTAGDGVPWLHVRLDSRPKYYHHQPYKQKP